MIGLVLVVTSLTLLLLFSSACTGRRRGEKQLSVSSKVGGLQKGHPLSFEGVYHGVAPSFSWSSSRSPAGILGVVCPEGGLVYGHTCDVSDPLDLLLFDVLQDWICSYHVSYRLISDFVPPGLIYCFSLAFHFTSDQFSLEVFC